VDLKYRSSKGEANVFWAGVMFGMTLTIPAVTMAQRENALSGRPGQITSIA
jgi:hypothetical protein